MQTKQEFQEFVSNLKEEDKPYAFGICRAEFGQKSGDIISVSYPLINVNENFGSWAIFLHASKISFKNNEIIYDIDSDFIDRCIEKFNPFLDEALRNDLTHKNIQVILMLKKMQKQKKLFEGKKSRFQLIAFKEDSKVNSLQVAYLKLYALSSGKSKLRSLDLNGIFNLLKNLAWSGNNAYELDYLRENEIHLRMQNEFPVIDYIDKFPRYLMKILPEFDNVRILDSSKTRFGAYLGEGYVQMPGASYVNFNSGSLGACMNEGRISSSVIVGKGSDIGGGASILGVLSGGNAMPINIGENCLLGANSVTGISLGDGCIVDAGVSILAGSVVEITHDQATKIKEVNADFEISKDNLYKGVTLSGLNGLHFRVDSKNGKMIAFRSTKAIELNKDLH